MYAEHFHENEWTELHTEAEADRLRELVDDCLTDPAHKRYAPPPTVSEATDSVFGNLMDPAWYCEMIARAAEHADWLDWQRTQEDARP